MRESKKSSRREKPAYSTRKTSAKVEPLLLQLSTNKLRDDIIKFVSENPYPLLRIHRNGTVLYANKASEMLLKTKGSMVGRAAPAEWHGLAKEVLASGRVREQEIEHEGRIFAFLAVPIADSNCVNFYGIDTTEHERLEEALEKERQELKLIIDSSPIIVFYKDKEGRFVRVNKALAEALNMPAEELLGKTVFDLYSAKIAQGMTNDDREVFTTKRPKLNIIEQYESARGLRWVQTDKVPIFDKDGVLVGLVGFAQDITERKRAEEALLKEKKLSEELINSSVDGILAYDHQCRYTIWNPGMERISGVKKEEALGRCAFDVFAFLKETGEDEFFYEALAGKTVVAKDRPYRVPQTGKKGFFEGHYAPLYDEEGNISGGLAVIRDITERKHAELALQASEERFRSLFEQAVDAIVVVDTKTGEIVELNEKACEMLGYSREEFAKLKLKDVEAIESEEEVATHINRIVKQGGDTFETKQRKKDGTSCDILVSAKLTTTAGKQYIQGIWRDITQLKKSEERLLKYQKQLKQLASQLTLAEERERRRIASELHDQVTQSLALAKIELDALCASVRSSMDADSLHETATALEKAIQDTRSLTFDLSYPVLYELGLEAAVAEWLSEQVSSKYGITSEFSDDGQPKPLDDDVRVLLFRNVRELLINVIKHARAHRVNVGIRRVDDFIEITVEDDGVGFDPAEAKAVAAKAARFGLFSIRESLEQLDGRFVIESRPGVGCKAIMTAPLKETGRRKE